VGYVICTGERRLAYMVLVGKPEDKKLLRINFTVIGWEGMDWIDMAQDRNKSWVLVNMVMNLQAS
jgi:hypothetical protein